MRPYSFASLAVAASLLFAHLPSARAQTAPAPTAPTAPTAPIMPTAPPIARPAPSEDYSPYVASTLSLVADTPGVTYVVMDPNDHDRVYMRCFAPCAVRLSHGTYYVRADGDGIPARARLVDLYGPRMISAEAGSSWKKNVGLLTGLVGTAVGVAATFTAVISSYSPDCTDSPHCEASGREAARAATLIALVAVPIGIAGWVTFGSYRTKLHESEENILATTVKLGVAPTVGGATFGMTGSF